MFQTRRDAIENLNHTSMSGHSKWSQIRHKKAITDAKKGNLFSKMVREITIAAKTGDPTPDANIRLKAAIERARAIGLPKDNIDRAVAKAAGQGESANLFEFLYEATASGGIAILIEGITDNKNRTINEIKHLLSTHDARLADPGSLLWNFEKVWTANSGHDYKPRSPLVLTELPSSLEILLEVLSEHDDVQKVYTNL